MLIPRRATHRPQVRRDVDLAVIDNQRLRRDRRQTDSRTSIATDEHAARDARIGQKPAAGAGLGVRADRLEQHQRRVDRLRRDRREPQRDHATAEQIHRDRQLHTDPSQRHRIHREHVQRRGIDQQVLARAGRDKPPVWRVRTVRDAALGLRRTLQRVRSPGQLPDRLLGLPPLRHHPGPVLLDRSRVDTVKQQLLRRATRTDMLIEHRSQHIQPTRIDPAQRLARSLVARVDQPSLAVSLQTRAPTCEGSSTPTPSSAAFAR